jgi:hypothetical protein
MSVRQLRLQLASSDTVKFSERHKKHLNRYMLVKFLSLKQFFCIQEATETTDGEVEAAAEASTEVIRRTEITTATEVNKGTCLFEIWNRSGFVLMFFLRMVCADSEEILTAPETLLPNPGSKRQRILDPPFSAQEIVSKLS